MRTEQAIRRVEESRPQGSEERALPVENDGSHSAAPALPAASVSTRRAGDTQSFGTATGTFSGDLVGRLIAGRFEVQRRLVHDSFGMALSALDRKTERLVSLRMVRSPQVTSRLSVELSAVATLTHPGLLAVTGVLRSGRAGSDDGGALIVQGALDGNPVGLYTEADRLTATTVSLDEACRIVGQLAGILTAVHANGPHGAVGPETVWLDSKGGVILTDLVIARALLASPMDEGEVQETRRTLLLAPEIKRGLAPQKSSDVYGLGALLYVLLTGRVPGDDWVAPSKLHPEANRAIDGVLRRGLSTTPGVRHATPEAFHAALVAAVRTDTGKAERPKKREARPGQLPKLAPVLSDRPSGIAPSSKTKPAPELFSMREAPAPAAVEQPAPAEVAVAAVEPAEASEATKASVAPPIVSSPETQAAPAPVAETAPLQQIEASAPPVAPQPKSLSKAPPPLPVLREPAEQVVPPSAQKEAPHRAPESREAAVAAALAVASAEQEVEVLAPVEEDFVVLMPGEHEGEVQAPGIETAAKSRAAESTFPVPLPDRAQITTAQLSESIRAHVPSPEVVAERLQRIKELSLELADRAREQVTAVVEAHRESGPQLTMLRAALGALFVVSLIVLFAMRGSVEQASKLQRAQVELSHLASSFRREHAERAIQLQAQTLGQTSFVLDSTSKDKRGVTKTTSQTVWVRPISAVSLESLAQIDTYASPNATLKVHVLDEQALLSSLSWRFARTSREAPVIKGVELSWAQVSDADLALEQEVSDLRKQTMDARKALKDARRNVARRPVVKAPATKGAVMTKGPVAKAPAMKGPGAKGAVMTKGPVAAAKAPAMKGPVGKGTVATAAKATSKGPLVSMVNRQVTAQRTAARQAGRLLGERRKAADEVRARYEATAQRALAPRQLTPGQGSSNVAVARVSATLGAETVSFDVPVPVKIQEVPVSQIAGVSLKATRESGLWDSLNLQTPATASGSVASRLPWHARNMSILGMEFMGIRVLQVLPVLALAMLIAVSLRSRRREAV